jgi:hypothetical protein
MSWHKAGTGTRQGLWYWDQRRRPHTLADKRKILLAFALAFGLLAALVTMWWVSFTNSWHFDLSRLFRR